MRSITKNDFIEYDDGISIILAFSIYNKKPVHTLRSFTDKIRWTKKMSVWDKTNKKFI